MSAWIQAARPLAHINIAVPLLLGHAAVWHLTRTIDWRWLVAALVWGALDHLFVVFANDFADRDADTGARTLLSGGSGVIPEGKLTARQIMRAAQVSAILLLGYSCVLSILGRGFTPLYGLAALALMWLYSFAPVRASYRGGGELLQGIGVGVGLPSLAFYLQTEAWLAPGWLIWPTALLGTCGNVLTGLPDVEVDTQADKRTWAVRYGVTSARRFASAGIAFAALGAFIYTPGLSIPVKAAVAAVPLMPLLVGARAKDPLAAAWWSSVAMNLFVSLWTLALIVEV